LDIAHPVGAFFMRGGLKSMHTSTGELLTVSEMAHRLAVPVHVITYVIKTRQIRPRRWVGHARLFDEHAVRRIQSELNGIRDDVSA
jgi:hypothetical protein